MRKWLPLVAICLGTVMLLIDVSIVNVALPQIAASLHASFSSLQWVIDAYALALAGLLLGIGSFADLIGHRRAYLTGLALFAVSSLACGLAPDAVALDVARGVQGVGAAAMMASSTALLNSTYQGADRGTAFGIWGAIAGAATAIGPVLGGVLVQAGSWRWIFFVNLPISALAIGMTARYLSVDARRIPRRVDLGGTLTFTVFAASLTYALIRAGAHGWATTSMWILVGIAAVSLLAFVAIEVRVEQPMLDLSLFRDRAFTGTMIASLCVTFAAFAGLTYSTIWLQTVIGLSPIQTGLTFLPLAGASFMVSVGIGRYLHRSVGPIIAAGMVLIGAGSLLNALLLSSDASWPQLMPGLTVAGVGVGLAMPTLTSAAMGAVRPQRGGMAAGAVSTVRQLGFAIGIASLGGVFAHFAANSLNQAGRPDAGPVSIALSAGQAHDVLTGAGTGRDLLDTALHHAALSGLHAVFLIAGITGILVGLLAYVLIRPSRTPLDTPQQAEPARGSA